MTRTPLARTAASLVGGTAAITVVALVTGPAGWREQVWTGLLGGILLAALLAAREVYLSLFLVMVSLRMWVNQEQATQPEVLLRLHLVPSLVALLAAEIIYRLNSERRRDEAVVWKSEERFRAIFESSGMGIAVLDRSGRFTMVNRAIQQMLGRTRNEIQDVSFVRWMHAEDAALNRQLYQELIGGEQDYYQREVRYGRTRGPEVWCRLSVSLVRNAEEQPEYAVAMLEDITVRKQSEEALRESERRYRSVVENIREVIFQADLSGRLTFLNPAWTEITGASAEESLGRELSEFLHEQDAELHREMVRPVLDGQQEFARYVGRFTHGAGGFRWVEVFLQAVEEAGARILSGTMYDITERKREEEERQRLAEQRANMIATVSHELRAPIAAMILSFDLLADGTLGELTDEQQEYVRGATTSIMDLGKTVDDLLAVSRLHDGRVKLHLERTDLTSLLAGVYERMLVRARASGVELRMEVEPGLPTIESDRQQLAHVLTELIENGIKYSRGRGEVTLGARRSGDEVLLEVTDTGPGIPEEERAHIFEPFYRSPAAMREQIPGTGLGLHIVNQITLLLGIELEVRSDPGRGTRFRLTAPLRFPRRPLVPAHSGF